MKSMIHKNDQKIVVNVKGKLNHEDQEPLRDKLVDILDQSKTDKVAKQIIFDFEGLEFVGSCGISHFVQTLKEFNTKTALKPKYVNVRNEFKKIIKSMDESATFEFEDSVPKPKKLMDQ